MTQPTITQQSALTYANKPFAIISLLATCGMIYHLLIQQPKKRKRMYHRIILALNISTSFYIIAEIWGNWAVPKGTPYYTGASGTIGTCRAQGFLSIMFCLTGPAYYASLSIYSYLAMKNKFQEERYQWIEKWIHGIVLIFPLAFTITVAVNDNIQPAGTGCFLGDKMMLVSYVFGFGQLFIYFVIPTSSMISVWRCINEAEKELNVAQGMRHLIESARKRVFRDTAIQISLYLFTFWFTFVFALAGVLVYMIQGERPYNLVIFGDCINLSQGFIMMLVYFQLERMARPKIRAEETSATHGKNCQTVSDIRAAAENPTTNVDGCDSGDSDNSAHVFSIFDGRPSEGSPWAQYIDQDSEDDVGSEEAASAEKEAKCLEMAQESG